MTDMSSSSDHDPTDDYLSDADADTIFPSDSDWADSWDAQSNDGHTTMPTEPEDGAARSPGSLIAVAYLTNAVSVVLLLIESDIVNWIGYALSGFLASVLIVSYWGIDQQRRALPNYVLSGHRTFLSVLSVLVGIVLAGLHGVALSQSVVPA